jgi:hypothetical protein
MKKLNCKNYHNLYILEIKEVEVVDNVQFVTNRRISFRYVHEIKLSIYRSLPECVSHLTDTRVKRWTCVLIVGIINYFQIVDSRKILNLFKYFEKTLSINYLLMKMAIRLHNTYCCRHNSTYGRHVSAKKHQHIISSQNCIYIYIYIYIEYNNWRLRILKVFGQDLSFMYVHYHKVRFCSKV